MIVFSTGSCTSPYMKKPAVTVHFVATIVNENSDIQDFHHAYNALEKLDAIFHIEGEN